MKIGGNLVLFGFIGLLVGVIFSMTFASAYYFPSIRGASESAINIVVDVFEPFLRAIFGGYGWSGLYLFERLMIFVILVSVIYLILGKVPMFEGAKGIRWIVSLIVPLIGVRFIDFESLSAIFMQYTIFAIILTSILPFILFFFFVHALGGDYPVLRKICWVVFVGIYIGLWSTTGSSTQSAVYFWTVAAAVIALLMDRRIEGYLAAKQFAKRDKWMLDNEIAKLNTDITKVQGEIRSGARDAKDGNRYLKMLKEQRDDLMRHRLKV